MIQMYTNEGTASAEELLPVPSVLPIALLPGFEDRTNSNKHAYDQVKLQGHESVEKSRSILMKLVLKRGEFYEKFKSGGN